jgi:hypothetical protein
LILFFFFFFLGAFKMSYFRFLLILICLITSQTFSFISYGNSSCGDLFSNRSTIFFAAATKVDQIQSDPTILAETVVEVGGTVVEKPAVELKEPFALLELEHPLYFRGKFRFTELVSDSAAPHLRAAYTERLVDQLKQQSPEIEFGPTDNLYSFDINGESGGLFRRIALQTLNKATMDFTGVHVKMVNYRADPLSSGKGRDRMVVVVKSNAIDYRAGNTKTLLSQKEIGYWLAEQLNNTFTELSSLRAFVFDTNSAEFKKALKALAKDSLYPQNEKEFLIAYRRGFDQFLNSLTALELLHLRPSFWDNQPSADIFSKTVYEQTHQTSSAKFEAGFAEQVSKLRLRLFRFVHKHRGSAAPVGQYIDVQDGLPKSERLQSSQRSIQVFDGRSAQESFGTDFYVGANNRFILIADLNIENIPLVDTAAEKLGRHGFT